MTNGENKSVSKSIRITPSAYSFIMKQKGEGFNEKLLNLLYWAFWHENETAERVKLLECRESRLLEQIDIERKVLKDLTDLHTGLYKVLERCADILGDEERYAAS